MLSVRLNLKNLVTIVTILAVCITFTAYIKNSDKQITAFNFTVPPAVGVIIEEAKIITVQVPLGTNVTALVPIITISEKATVNPASGVAQNFTSPVMYTVTAVDGSTEVYTVKVTAGTGDEDDDESEEEDEEDDGEDDGVNEDDDDGYNLTFNLKAVAGHTDRFILECVPAMPLSQLSKSRYHPGFHLQGNVTAIVKGFTFSRTGGEAPFPYPFSVRWNESGWNANFMEYTYVIYYNHYNKGGWIGNVRIGEVDTELLNIGFEDHRIRSITIGTNNPVQIHVDL